MYCLTIADWFVLSALWFSLVNLVPHMEFALLFATVLKFFC